jgi:lipopolysaccharide transport system permease protein
MTDSSTTVAGAHSPEAARWLVIDARRAERWIDWRELWGARELIVMLAARDVKVRYRQAAVGIAWVILQPVIEMLLFGGLFSLLGRTPVSQGVPAGLSLFSGLLLWQLAASIVTACTGCLVDNRHILTKIYFPRLALPLAAALRPLVDFGVAGSFVAALCVWYGFVPGITIVVLPLAVLATTVAALGVGIWLAALNAHYRDFGFLVPFVVRVGFFVSPVVYETTSLIPVEWRLVASLNPMTSLLGLFRWSLLGTPAPTGAEVLVSSVVAVGLMLSGLWYFRRVERFLSDWI